MASWFGSSLLPQPLFYRNILEPAPEPIPFNPSTDVSGLAFWLDANDDVTVDVSGTDVLSWSEKLKGVDIYEAVDLSNCPQYGIHTMNGLPVVYFPVNSALRDSMTVLDFNDRTCFVVCKPLVFDLSGIVPQEAFLDFYHGDATADMQLGLRYYDVSGVTTYSICQNGINCGVQFDISANPLNTKMILAWRQSSSDLSGNAGYYDTVNIPLLNSELSSFNPDGQYTLSSTSKNQSLDIAELLIYDSVLSDSDVTKVLDYLADKWNLSGATGSGVNSGSVYTNQNIPIEEPKTPPPKTPEPFAYTYIIYGAFGEDPTPNWYWCDENAQVESPPVLAGGYDGTTALRDGLAVVVSGVFYA
jgi:hypothetical protein